MAARSAYERLLVVAERADCDAPSAARFLGSLYDGTRMRFDLSELRTVGIDVADDMQACLEALRSGQASLHDVVPDGARRVQALCATVLRPWMCPASREWVEASTAVAYPWVGLTEEDFAYEARRGGELFCVSVLQPFPRS